MEIRIQKVLSDNGIASRRKAEQMIEEGRIKVNGRPVKLGDKVDPVKDIISIDGENLAVRKNVQKYYFMLNKPRGYITTQSDEMGRRCVADLMAETPVKVYPIGRLDKNSEGALLFTNDGEFANMIMHPSHHISKTYRVTVRPDIKDDQMVQLASGVEIDGRMTAPAQVKVLEKENGRVVLQMTIYEGRNRQIRKMCEAVGLEVARLKRVSIGPVKLGMLQPGEWRELTTGEIAAIRNALRGNTPEGEAIRQEKIRQNRTMAKNFGRPVQKKNGGSQQEGKKGDFQPKNRSGKKNAPRGSFAQIEKSFNKSFGKR
ncbi:MAG: rRNA pseudouridine synthase [Oscillospiraceae bacterium]|nr:rRNA pseudouridine synthase [Oscillospiraceae bacterium]